MDEESLGYRVGFESSFIKEEEIFQDDDFSILNPDVDPLSDLLPNNEESFDGNPLRRRIGILRKIPPEIEIIQESPTVVLQSPFPMEIVNGSSSLKRTLPPPTEVISESVKIAKQNRTIAPPLLRAALAPAPPTLIISVPSFIFNTNLCRICLLEKEYTKSIFENLTFHPNGLLKNIKGIAYRVMEAMKTLLNIDAKQGDGLPDQVCTDCLDLLLQFSVFRKHISNTQAKLETAISQVANISSPPILLGRLGEKDNGFVDREVFKNLESIDCAKEIIRASKFCHLVHRSIPDRIWDKIFKLFSKTKAHGLRLPMVQEISEFAFSKPYVVGWMCSLCNHFVHESLDELEKHNSTVHKDIDPDDSILYPCEICGMNLKLKANKNLGYTMHWFEHFLPHPCTKINCSRRFLNAQGLRYHNSRDCKVGIKVGRVVTESSNEKLNLCEICGEEVTSSLFSHIKNAHPEQTELMCDTCPTIFEDQSSLQIHKDTMHSLSCEKCDKTGFKTNTALKHHLQIVHREKSWICEFEDCGKACSSKSDLKDHSLKHQESVIPCTFPGCEKLFKRQGYLKEHMLIHNGVMPFTCEICGKQVRMKCNLKKHMKTHKKNEKKKEREKPYADNDNEDDDDFQI